MNLFGKKKQIPLVSPNDAINKLHGTIDLLSKREEHLEKCIDRLKKDALIAYKAKKKPRAIHLLSQSKSFESQLISLFGMRANVEQQISALSQALFSQEAFKAMQTSRDVLKNVESTIDPDNVADTMDDLEDVMVGLSEVTEAISRPIGRQTESDDELLRELEEDMLSEEMMTKPTIEIVIPCVPVKIPSREEAEIRDEEELKKIFA